MPTFGYTSLGGGFQVIARRRGSPASGPTSFRAGRVFTLTEGGTLDSIHVGLSISFAGSADITAYLNNEDSAGTGSHGQVVAIERADLSVATTSTFYTFTASNESLTAGEIVLNALANASDLPSNSNLYDIRLRSDITTNANVYLESNSSYVTLQESPWTEGASNSGTTYSIYATYTASTNSGFLMFM